MRKGVFIFWSIFIAGALIRVVFSLHQDMTDIGVCNKQLVTGKGIVTQDPARTETGQVLVVSTQQLFPATTSARNTFSSSNDSCASSILIRMKTKLYPRFVYGDQVSFSGKISKPFNFKSGTGRAFDYVGYLAKDDVFYEIKSAKVESISINYPAKNPEDGINDSPKTDSSDSQKQGTGLGGKISGILFYLKRRFVSNLEQTLGEPHAALAAGLVVGEKSALGKDLLNDFRIVGLIHIVVLSGFNITVVGDAMRRMLSFLPRVWGISIGGIGIGLFGIMVGGGATVVRSCFMAGVALSADLIRRDYDVTRALMFAGLIMLIQNPLILLHDPSFQLSFLATLGLILLASPIEKHLTLIPEKFGIRGIVASTIATQIFVSPYILYMMGTMSIIGMIVNILVLPIIPITMLVVFLTGATGFISLPASQFFGWISHLFLSYELHMVEWFAQVPFASVTLPMFSGWWVVGFYVGFGVVFWGRGWFFHTLHVLFQKMQYRKVLLAVEELSSFRIGEMIPCPETLLYVGTISKKTMEIIGANTQIVMISRRAVKHIIERRGPKTSFIFKNMLHVLVESTKIIDNSTKRNGSFIIAKQDGKIIGVVVEITKTPDGCQVVSAFPMRLEAYEKLVDYSGRAEFPPFELSP